MRGIAASRVQEAHEHVESIRTYADTIGDAIGHALSFLPGGRAPAVNGPTGKPIVVLIAAEQGFAGTFNEKVFESAAPLLDAPHDLLIVGDRGFLSAQERQLPVAWSDAMIAHPAQTSPLASRIAEAVYDRLAHGGASQVWLIHALPGASAGLKVEMRHLIPFDYDRFPLPRNRDRPLLTLEPGLLLERLVEEYIFAELSEAVMLSFAAENEARMRAMIAAHDNVTTSLQDLAATARRLRQEEITEEIMELATGSLMAP